LFNSLFSRTTREVQHQIGRTILDYSKARDGWVAVHQWTIGNHLHFTSQTPTNSVTLLKALPGKSGDVMEFNGYGFGQHNNNSRLTAFCPGLPGDPMPERWIYWSKRQ